MPVTVTQSYTIDFIFVFGKVPLQRRGRLPRHALLPHWAPGESTFHPVHWLPGFSFFWTVDLSIYGRSMGLSAVFFLVEWRALDRRWVLQ